MAGQHVVGGPVVGGLDQFQRRALFVNGDALGGQFVEDGFGGPAFGFFEGFPPGLFFLRPEIGGVCRHPFGTSAVQPLEDRFRLVLGAGLLGVLSLGGVLFHPTAVVEPGRGEAQKRPGGLCPCLVFSPLSFIVTIDS
jgi:hypothetical protein